MLALLRQMSPVKYQPRQYVVAATDALGWTKAKHTEEFFKEAQASKRVVEDKVENSSLQGVSKRLTVNIALVNKQRIVAIGKDRG